MIYAAGRIVNADCADAIIALLVNGSVPAFRPQVRTPWHTWLISLDPFT